MTALKFAIKKILTPMVCSVAMPVGQQGRDGSISCSQQCAAERERERREREERERERAFTCH